jgi:hypothetical protein
MFREALSGPSRRTVCKGWTFTHEIHGVRSSARLLAAKFPRRQGQGSSLRAEINSSSFALTAAA